MLFNCNRSSDLASRALGAMYSTFLKRLCRRRHPIPVNSCRGLLCYLHIEPQNYSSPVSVWCIDFMWRWVSADNYLWQSDKQRFTDAVFFSTSDPIPGSFSLHLSWRVMRPLAHSINLSVDSKFWFQAKWPKIFTSQLLKCDQRLLFLWSYRWRFGLLVNILISKSATL